MITDLLIVFTGLLGLITFIIILFRYKSNRVVNIYLAIIIFLFSLRFLLIGLKGLFNTHSINSIFQSNNIYFIIIGPCFYLYFKNLVISKKNFAVKDLFHFIIPLLLILLNRFSIVENFRIKGIHSFLYFFLIYCIVYSIHIYIKLRREVWNKKGSLEIIIKQNTLIKKWSFFLYVAINIMIVRLIISMIFELKRNSFISGEYLIFITSIIWIVIFIKILITPEILYGYSLLNKKSKENKNYVTTKISHWKEIPKVKITNIQDLQLSSKINPNIEKYIDAINYATRQNDLFREPKFKLTDFALKLNIPKSHLSYLFKYHSKISFSDYKKIARIEYALHLIQSDYLKTNTFDSLAKEVGFSSYNPFFTSFKDIIGKPPQEYCSTLESQS
jgi:AraC-like DNA-binding protein